MREIIEKRTRTSKTYDLGNGTRRCVIGQLPMHFDEGGQWHDIDLEASVIDARGHYVLRQCPYVLKISADRPAYEYTSRSGRRVDVELLANAGAPMFEGGLYKWGDVGRDADYVIQPLPHGAATLLVLNGPQASRSWFWRIRGDMALLQPLIGKDSGGRILELVERRDADAGVITVEWTGRAISPGELRRKDRGDMIGAGWTSDVTWPVVIDPTVNENIAANGDDAGSGWISSGAVFAAFSAGGTIIYAGVNAGTVRYYAGLRFQTIAIPPAASITSATLTIRATAISGAPDLNIYGNKVDDAAAFATPGNRIKNMTKTTAFTNKSSWTANADNAITVTSIIAEILGRAGWASNNDVAFGFFRNNGSNLLRFAALEHATLTEARLSIDYSTGGAVAGDHFADKHLTQSRFTNPRFLKP